MATMAVPDRIDVPLLSSSAQTFTLGNSCNRNKSTLVLANTGMCPSSKDSKRSHMAKYNLHQRPPLIPFSNVVVSLELRRHFFSMLLLETQTTLRQTLVLPAFAPNHRRAPARLCQSEEA